MPTYTVRMTRAFIRYENAVVEVTAPEGTDVDAIAHVAKTMKVEWTREEGVEDMGSLDVEVSGEDIGSTSWREDF